MTCLAHFLESASASLEEPKQRSVNNGIMYNSECLTSRGSGVNNWSLVDEFVHWSVTNEKRGAIKSIYCKIANLSRVSRLVVVE